MRVPVYPDDLVPNRGVKRLAKILHKKWCGPNPVSLSHLREVVSRGLGYRDYHDLLQASKLSHAGEPSPVEAEVRLGILSALKAVLEPEEWPASDYAQLERLVATLPLFSLTALNSQKLPKPHTINEGSTNPETRVHNLVTPYLASTVPQPSSDQLRRIAGFVAASGSMRDHALLIFLMSGLRPLEFLPCKVDQIKRFTAGEPMIEIQAFRASTSRALFAMPNSIHQYIQASKLSSEDYLFASDRDSKSPMTIVELRRIFACWARGAGIEPNLVVPKKSNYSVTIKRAAQMASR
ncbi:hypothetical protein [Pseudomonas sp. GZD-222]|uniref:hypothetical protein n=1 Tax=Pseudomonas sp. GZD-222 TaxID=3404805 RepID=UPI003BB77BAA